MRNRTTTEGGDNKQNKIRRKRCQKNTERGDNKQNKIRRKRHQRRQNKCRSNTKGDETKATPKEARQKQDRRRRDRSDTKGGETEAMPKEARPKRCQRRRDWRDAEGGETNTNATPKEAILGHLHVPVSGHSLCSMRSCCSWIFALSRARELFFGEDLHQTHFYVDYHNFCAIFFMVNGRIYVNWIKINGILISSLNLTYPTPDSEEWTSPSD